MSHAHRAAARSASVSHAALGPSSVPPELEPILAGLVKQSFENIRSGTAREDEVFGDYADLNFLVRAVTFHEGKLLEAGLERIAALDPDLRVVRLAEPLPIVPAALELLERNDWATLEAIALPSEVFAKTSYMPDLVIVDRVARRAHILDVKRSLSSYPENKIKNLRRKMMASALAAGDVLYKQGLRGIEEIDVAIIDGSSEQSEPQRGIFALHEVSDLFRLSYAGAAMLRLRQLFAQRVREEMRELCLRMAGIADAPTPPRPADLASEAEDKAEAGDPQDHNASGTTMPRIRVGFPRCLGAIDPAGRA